MAVSAPDTAPDYDDEETTEDDGSPLGETGEELDESTRSLVGHIIRQLKPGSDLTRVTLPSFILEPRSLLEKCTDFMAHPSLVMGVNEIEDPEARMIAVTTWFMSGWHVRPKGVKKPYNPILGEIFRAAWWVDKEEEGPITFLAEQVSHHPPITAYIFKNSKKNVVLEGSLYTRSKFLGLSAASISEGSGCLHLLKLNEQYKFNYPSVYVRGIVVGTLRMEICGKVEIRCEQSGYWTEIDFRAKPTFGGEYHVVKGAIYKGQEKLYTIAGHWDSITEITNVASKETKVLFSSEMPVEVKVVPPFEEMDKMESKRLWRRVTRALLEKNVDLATEHKKELEDAQRDGKKIREDKGIDYTRRYFHRLNRNADIKQDQWAYNDLDLTPYSPGDEPKPVPLIESSSLGETLPESLLATDDLDDGMVVPTCSVATWMPVQ